MGALVSVAEAISESAETIGVVSGDMKDFLQSDSDEVPNSLKQISKIARSEHFSDSFVSVTRALTVGVLRGYQSMNRTDADQTSTGSSSTVVDRLLDKLLTPAGSGFASVVLGSFARNLVLAYYSDPNAHAHAHAHFGGESNSSNATSGVTHVGSKSGPVPTWVDVVCGERCGELIGNCVQLFVSTAVAVYLDKTMGINPYDDFFAGLTNPKYETRMRDILLSLCNGSIETLVKTSHQVLTSSNPNVNSSSPSYLAIGETPSPARNEDLGVETSSIESKAGDVCDEENESGWVSKVSSTLAVPSNRRLVLDVTGRVTFETVRSFMEFLLQTFCASVKRCAHIVHDALVEILCLLLHCSPHNHGTATFQNSLAENLAFIIQQSCTLVCLGA
ncbi:protein PHLOEM PROTEIN 2-LIKE A10-like isoform X2 [Gastrolobium bilobum]|uniref:protein PHLOEM PROTEIN 2-LIKE A10-like isoform X2 n=1 Tax=Gastrolobium bilobum TaxID=150636 RepID=UPI002AB088B0|nr:protein PHLOEM PROTEIN 2-LIKE A10-like isoform X2 [Gastrolobium bilobum]XP_061338893.1 protein PHLOEM PROTEIN 2-LIKE A10-like isoform X2 [Gastrolobium bilobum]